MTPGRINGRSPRIQITLTIQLAAMTAAITIRTFSIPGAVTPSQPDSRRGPASAATTASTAAMTGAVAADFTEARSCRLRNK